MGKDGKQLEALVAFIEKLHLPLGFEVKTNDKVYNENGVQIAEFDVEIRGKLGTTEIAWLIECRDRPGAGPQPGAWIEQLVGRRVRFGFNKVTAVSTTGFAQGAIEFAADQGIEIREVNSVAPEHFSWLCFQSLPVTDRQQRLDYAQLILAETESAERQAAFVKVIGNTQNNEPLLRSTKTGDKASVLGVFLSEVSSRPVLFEGVIANQTGKLIAFTVGYPNDDDHYVVDTDCGPIRVQAIRFAGELSLKTMEIPVSNLTEYSNAGGSNPISQSASFPFHAFNKDLSLEMHNIGKTGETHVVLRIGGKPNA